jgi:hypothetical protein
VTLSWLLQFFACWQTHAVFRMLELVLLSCQIQRFWNIFTLFLLNGYRLPPTNGTNILCAINLVFYMTTKTFVFSTKQKQWESKTGKESTVCPTRYRTRHLFNNSSTNEDIAKKFEQGYVRCVRNEEECVCSVCL